VPKKRENKEANSIEEKDRDLRKKGACPYAPTAKALCFFSLPYLVVTFLNVPDGYGQRSRKQANADVVSGTTHLGYANYDT